MPKLVNVLDRPPPRFFTAVSYSRWSDHATCPRRARLGHLDKWVAPGTVKFESPAMKRGGDIHKLAEDYTKGDLKRLPKELKAFKEEFADLRKRKASVEGKWGITRDWQPCAFDDWNRCWLRVVTDAHHPLTPTRMRVIDHKTGKVYGTNEDQLELYAVGTFVYYPTATEVETQLWYLDQGVILPDPVKVYHRKDLAKLQKKWRERFIPMLTDKKFVPRPGPHCHRCDFAKAKGGPCEFGG